MSLTKITLNCEKVIYICVYKPNGSIAGNNSKFKLSTGAEKGYTTSKTISYKQGEKVNDIYQCDRGNRREI